MYSALLWSTGNYREANFIPALIMSFLMMDCPTLEQAPLGSSELSVFRGEHADDWPMGIRAQADGGNDQRFSWVLSSPGCMWTLYKDVWLCKLLCVILLMKAQSVFSLIHLFRAIGVNKLEISRRESYCMPYGVRVTSYVPTTVSRTSPALSHLFLIRTPCNFVTEETESQRSDKLSPRSHS